ncbi:28S ribosomal protein S5, mitochondrial [Corythoichthys intestinalis]|uniref:28S ribosomal protein S5, mitochondrial n=1 Tax=Corythoichthys intestinalis TaxID=161448 RepID=UPI0025A51635|nr:28S ribosomal protein S5, mitochondrial [Corythoichthys intestinalis]XP_061794710.1 28S ribosomal protein S5, mitochondrial [Nerophis lumbriciformis]
MAAAVRVCCALRVAVGGRASLRSIGGAFHGSHLLSGWSPAPPLVPVACWQQSRHGSFFNKLTAEELWKGVLAESGAGGRKGRGKRTKRKLKKDLNRGQTVGEGKGGFLWPGLNVPVLKDGTVQSMSRRGDAEQQEVKAELVRQRDEWERRKKMKIKRERGWTGKSWGGISLGPPDPGPNGETYEDFDSRVIEVKSVFNMTAKEGRKRSISCLVAVGNGQGAAGFAVGKAADRNIALRKAKNRAIHYLYYIERYNNHTIYHDIDSKFKRTTLRMKKQNEGYGLHCHRAVITMCKLIGLKDMYCKVEGSVNLLNITRALFSGLAKQETHQLLADKKQLHVVEYRQERGPLPVVVASPKEGARAQPEPEDEIPDTRLHWADVQAAQGLKRSIWAGVKHTVW